MLTTIDPIRRRGTVAGAIRAPTHWAMAVDTEGGLSGGPCARAHGREPSPEGRAQPAQLVLVDDDVDTAEILADVLRGEGHKVRVARDGREGLALVDVDQPDLVIVDVEMPRLSGPEMAHQMFLHDLGLQDIPIILCSGVLNLADIASRVGTPYYLTKPYTLDAILGLVSRVLVERTPPVPHPATRQR